MLRAVRCWGSTRVLSSYVLAGLGILTQLRPARALAAASGSRREVGPFCFCTVRAKERLLRIARERRATYPRAARGWCAVIADRRSGQTPRSGTVEPDPLLAPDSHGQQCPRCRGRSRKQRSLLPLLWPCCGRWEHGELSHCFPVLRSLPHCFLSFLLCVLAVVRSADRFEVPSGPGPLASSLCGIALLASCRTGGPSVCCNRIDPGCRWTGSARRSRTRRRSRLTSHVS